MTSPMIRSKREFVCNICSKKYLRWEGKCRNCKATNSLVEHTLIPPKATASPTQRALGRRSKKSERDIARRMVQVDGPDPAFEHIASSTGRIGHITNIRVDAISKNYVTENKNRLLPKWLMDAWLLINQRAVDFNRNCLLHLDPPNMPKDFVINGERKKLSTLAVITQDRHEELIRAESVRDAVLSVLFGPLERTDAEAMQALRVLLGNL